MCREPLPVPILLGLIETVVSGYISSGLRDLISFTSSDSDPSGETQRTVWRGCTGKSVGGKKNVEFISGRRT